MGQLCLCLIIEKPDLFGRARSSELRSLVYYIGYLNVRLINFNLFQKKYPDHILYVGIGFSEDLSEREAVNCRSPVYYSLCRASAVKK